MQGAVCWALTTGEAGMASQARGLADAIGMPYLTRTSCPRKPWRWLPGHLCPGVLGGLTADSDLLQPPWPDLLISCGRRSTPLSIAIRKRSEGKTFTVHIQDPRIPPQYFDLVIPMSHDPIRGDNVFPTDLAMHPITDDWLATARSHFIPLLGKLPKPLIAVLIGGRTRKHPFPPEECMAISEQLLATRETHDAGMVISTSRRTGPENTKILQRKLSAGNTLIWTGEGENPYAGMLALADFIIVTEDSVSMVSEACASGKPVFTIPLHGRSGRLDRFHENLRDRGLTKRLSTRLEPFAAPQNNDTPRIASLVRSRLAARGITCPSAT